MNDINERKRHHTAYYCGVCGEQLKIKDATLKNPNAYEIKVEICFEECEGCKNENEKLKNAIKTLMNSINNNKEG